MRASGGWTAWVAGRFLTGRRGGRGCLIFLFAVILICVGVAALNTILAVMNGLQQGYIRSILEVGSYHLRWSPEEGGGEAESEFILNFLEEDPRVSLALPFREGQTMINGRRPRPSGTLLRGLPDDALERDTGMAANLEIVEGSFTLAGGGIVLGGELALDLGAYPGDEITALDLGGSGFSPAEIPLTVTGVFRCGYREYESALAFVSLETAAALFGASAPEIGAKLVNPDRDRPVLADARKALESSGAAGTLMSWRVTNSSFFGALRTEKVVMLLLLTLIFVVVAVNIDHALRRMATERTEDLSLLKAFGASPGEIRLLFLRHGLMIGASGGLTGSVLGVLIGANVASIQKAVQSIRSFLEGVLGIGGPGGRPADAFFKHSEVMAGDVVTILILSVSLSVLAAVRAAAMAARSKPAEVLRSE